MSEGRIYFIFLNPCHAMDIFLILSDMFKNKGLDAVAEVLKEF
jgi:hypothetical protein